MCANEKIDTAHAAAAPSTSPLKPHDENLLVCARERQYKKGSGGILPRKRASKGRDPRCTTL
ncbi:MAG: hypothetical protein FD149_167 [Rhodospirillaceae bacterium]|nr:MAG: hypothetical protein FD149_167 [Rhodospirillaceae bacterium]